MTIKEELHDLIEGLSEEEANEMLAGLQALRAGEHARIPEWQKEEILRREADLLANPDSSVDWETVKREIRSRHGR